MNLTHDAMLVSDVTRGSGEPAMGQMGFFDIANRYAGLDAKNDPLVKIDEVVPWEDFRPRLEAAWRKPAEDRKSPAGRKPWDALVMFKAIVLCALYNLSDDQVEYQLRDRLSFILKIDLSVDIGGIEAGMTEPGADRVEIDPGLKQVAGARVADHVRRNRPPDEGWHTGGTALDKPIDPEPRIPSLPAEKDGIGGCRSRTSSASTRSVRGHSGH